MFTPNSPSLFVAVICDYSSYQPGTSIQGQSDTTSLFFQYDFLPASSSFIRFCVFPPNSHHHPVLANSPPSVSEEFQPPLSVSGLHVGVSLLPLRADATPLKKLPVESEHQRLSNRHHLLYYHIFFTSFTGPS